MLNIAYFWPVVYQAFFETPDDHDEKPLLAGRFGGRTDPGVGSEVGDPVRADGGADEADSADSADHAGGRVHDERDGHEEGGDHDDHGNHDGHHGGPPAGGWEDRGWTGGESTWFMLGPILAAAAGAVALGVVPATALFLRIVQRVVADVGVVL
jgi:NADH-quinone oxidoreductase subunit L/multicomponent Na+:H+ antiporter subunit D